MEANTALQCHVVLYNYASNMIIVKAKISEAVQKTDLEFLDITPSSAQLVGAEIELVSLRLVENLRVASAR